MRQAIEQFAAFIDCLADVLLGAWILAVTLILIWMSVPIALMAPAAWVDDPRHDPLGTWVVGD